MLSPEDHQDLRRNAERLNNPNHPRYLNEALAALRRRPDNPRHALELLAAMQGTAYAERNQEAWALYDIGSWLETRLKRPDTNGARLIEEVGWLRRLVQGRRDRVGGGEQTRPQKPPRFGAAQASGHRPNAPRKFPNPH